MHFLDFEVRGCYMECNFPFNYNYFLFHLSDSGCLDLLILSSSRYLEQTIKNRYLEQKAINTC